MKNKIYLFLSGGLGNQLFQYAAAKNLAIKNNCKLVIDVNSGFLINSIYTLFKENSKFSLNKNKIKKVYYKNIIFMFLFFKIFKKLRKFFCLKDKLLNYFADSLIINESLLSIFSKKILNIKIKKNLYLLGYFQSEKYFLENKNFIIKEIFPLKSRNNIFINMKNKIKNCNSVSLGIRVHENFNTNNLHKFGGIASLEFYKRAINNILKKVENPNFFIFSTNSHNVSHILKNIPILNKYKFSLVTSDLGYKDAYNTLWLMSYCKNHIISNSTLYWWGAYFSQIRYKRKIIICSGNFPNKDTCLDEWKF